MTIVAILRWLAAPMLAVALANAQPPAAADLQAATPPEGQRTATTPTNAVGPAVTPAPSSARVALKYSPLTNSQKLDRTLGRLVRPAWVLFAGLGAGYSQWRNRPPQWGQGAEGYGRRFGTIYGISAFRQSVLFAGAALHHEDLRRLRSERRGFWPRTGDALRLAFLSRRDDGSLGFAYARVVSDLGTIALARAAYPDRGPFTRRTMSRVALSYGVGREVLGVVREFTPDLLKALHLGKMAKRVRRP